MDNIPIEEMPKEIDRLLEINEELKDRIDKAIIEIKKRSPKEVADLYISILNGSDKE